MRRTDAASSTLHYKHRQSSQNAFRAKLREFVEANQLRGMPLGVRVRSEG